MPFVTRKVEPRFVCRGHMPKTAGAARDWPVGAELEAVANGALTASLKQLASLLVAAEDIFAELTAELAGIADRSGRLRSRLDGIEERLVAQDPKKIPVPESDICTFALRTEHFHLTNEPERCLFTLKTRPKALRQLYEAAATVAVRSLDSLRRDLSTIDSIDMFLCTPILGKRKRDQSLDIESRVPRAIEDLRRWTSTEALGDVTVSPDCASRIMANNIDDSQPVDHKLPSPEEQSQTIALKFPAEIVAVDVSGRGFQRMSMRRKSLHTGQETQELVKRRSRARRPRGKRRNTIAGTDQKEIREAVGGETVMEDSEARVSSSAKRAHRSASTDLLDNNKKDSSVEKKSHFNTLKAWGRSRFKLISPKSSQPQNLYYDGSGSAPTLSPEQKSSRQQSAETSNDVGSPDDNVLDSLTAVSATTVRERRARRETVKSLHERKPSSSSSSGKSVLSVGAKHHATSSASANDDVKESQDKEPQQLLLQTSSPSRQSSVKMRESAAERRERRKASGCADEPPHSSSGNWSASSESGRASIGSETTTITHPPRSTTTASIGTSSTSLSHSRRLKGRDTSASSSVTSEGTLTPDIIQDINAVPFLDDGETSSIYSCDTEGYYTSFHVDSGLKTLREEEPLTPLSPQIKTNELQLDATTPIVENEYELFGRGSTSTTTSSAGTVCTTLAAPPPPERKSSLTVVAMVHKQNQNGGESPDSGHNTSSSPVESASSPACTARSCSEFEYSESSDLEGCERIERIRSKTAINTSRIPSMCVITPPNSDDEHHKDADTKESAQKQKKSTGSVLMSATVGTSKMEVINDQDKNLYATVQTVTVPSTATYAEKGNNPKVSPLSGVLGKLRGVLPGRKHQQRHASNQEAEQPNFGPMDSGDYVTIADVRNNNDKRRQDSAGATSSRPAGATYANASSLKADTEYVSLSDLPRKSDSSLERRRQGARVTLDSHGKVVYSSDSLKRRKGTQTTFIPGPFVKEGPVTSAPSPLLHRTQITPRAVQRTGPDVVDGQDPSESSAPVASQKSSGKVIIRAAKSPDRAVSPDYVRTPAAVIGPTTTTPTTTTTGAQKLGRHGAYVNVQVDGSEGKTATRPKGSVGNGRRLPGSPRAKSISNEGNSAEISRVHAEVRNSNARGLNGKRNKLTENKLRPKREIMLLELKRNSERSLEQKILKSRSPRLSKELNTPWSYPQSLVPNGNTPKLVRRLPLFELESFKNGSNVQSTVLYNNKNIKDDVNLIESKANEATINLSESLVSQVTEAPLTERKLKRSDSYRMANSPIMFIKKLGTVSSFSDKNVEKKIFRTASEELREELMKERINYPESVASPEPEIENDDDIPSNLHECSGIDTNVNIVSKKSYTPRPRAVDLEPVKALKHFVDDTEIW